MREQQSMRVVAITAFGGPERLTLMEMPRPVPGPDAQRLAVLTHMVDAGQLAVHLDRTLPLEEARQAHELLEAGHVRGKIALTINRGATRS